MGKEKLQIVADFETRNSIQDLENGETSVWLWDICDTLIFSHTNGTDIGSFFDELLKLPPSICYFHNLKFDGQFILNYLFANGFFHIEDGELSEKQFKTLITSDGLFYSIKVCLKGKGHKKKHIVEFRDSLKKINGTVEKIAKSFNLPISKGEIDYTAFRPIGYKPTPEELSYVQRDTEIIARVLKQEFEKGLTKLTTASDTMALYKLSVGYFFDYFFPELDLETDDYIRKSYRGGVVILNEKYKEKVNDFPVYVFDINSMYPTQMVNKELPWGFPEYYTGEYEFDEVRPLYICRIKFCGAIKKGYYPTILLNTSRYSKLDYLIDTDGELIELTLTSVDLKRLLLHYDIEEIEYIDGYKFKGSNGLFYKFINPIYKSKCETKGAEKELNKLLLNGLYGKFATNPRHQRKIPYYEDNMVKYKQSEVTIDKSIYTAVSSFITAYARDYLYENIQNNYDTFIYCDTDSLHLTEEIKGAEIHDTKLGAFKLEKTYVKSKYLAQKSYYGIKEDGTVDIKLAGCPKNVKEKIKLETFNFGNEFDGKLLPKNVKGGALLLPYTFTIKNR